MRRSRYAGAHRGRPAGRREALDGRELARPHELCGRRHVACAADRQDDLRKYLFDTVERCLKVPQTEVQLKIITTLDSLKAVVVLSHFSQKVLEPVLRLAHDRSWRCHLQTIKLIPELITPLFDCQDELVKVSTSTLVDPVNATRMVVLG